MTIDEFTENMGKWLEKEELTDYYSYGTDLSVNTEITVDSDGLIWINESAGDYARLSFKRLKTTVNVSKVIEFRGSLYSKGFYIICDDDTGFELRDDGIYYYIDGEPSGWGEAYEHFTRFPDGVVK